jgi:hypothetical protein
MERGFPRDRRRHASDGSRASVPGAGYAASERSRSNSFGRGVDTELGEPEARAVQHAERRTLAAVLRTRHLRRAAPRSALRPTCPRARPRARSSRNPRRPRPRPPAQHDIAPSAASGGCGETAAGSSCSSGARHASDPGARGVEVCHTVACTRNRAGSGPRRRCETSRPPSIRRTADRADVRSRAPCAPNASSSSAD